MSDIGDARGAGGAPLTDAAAPRLYDLLAGLVGRRLPKDLLEQLSAAAGELAKENSGCDVLDAVTASRYTAADGRTVHDADLDLLDAALAAGVPVTGPTADVGFALSTWLGRRRRGGLRVLADDPRFRPLLRDAVFDGRADLLALGVPGGVLAERAGAGAAVLTAPGLLEVVAEQVTAWAAAAADGLGLADLYEAVLFLDLLGPAEVVRACPRLREAVGGLLGTDVAALLAATWRTGVLDELGSPALDAFDGFQHTDQVCLVRLTDTADTLTDRTADGTGTPVGGAGERTDPIGAFAVYSEHRVVVVGHHGLLAGPLHGESAALARAAAAADPDGVPVVDLCQGRVRATAAGARPVVPAGDDRTEVFLPAGTAVRRITRHSDGGWELRDTDGAVTARWRAGASRPDRALGARSVGRHRHRWAAGSEMVAPPRAWHLLDARDPAGSRALRAADRALAARVLDALGADLTARVLEVGRRIPVGTPSHEVVETARALRTVLEPLLPDVTNDRLLDGLSVTVWTAVECRELMARHLQRALSTRPIDTLADTASGGPVLRERPLPYPRSDAGDLRARVYTGMQRMYLRLGEVANACASPAVPLPPLTVELANAEGWEEELGRLGGRALRTALAAGPADVRGEELLRDGLRAWGVEPVCDPAGRWRTLRLRVGGRGPLPAGSVCRTPRGALVVVAGGRAGEVRALEYSADGRFDDPAFGSVLTQRVCTGWGGAGRVADLLRLRDRNGPAPWPSASVSAFADAIGLSVDCAAVLTMGFPARDAYRAGRGMVTVPDRSGLSRGRLTDADRQLAGLADAQQRLVVPELLMPDDPADLWGAAGLAVQRAATWWNARHRR